MDGYYIGLSLAIISAFVIGISFVFKKKGLIRIAEKGLRAGNGGYGYLKEFIWWTGMILMTFGEILNFAAYSFAPASLVTPLGAISVLVTAIASSIFLGEHLNILGKLGCILCIAGSIVIVIHAPQDNYVKSVDEIHRKLTQTGFISYSIFVFVFVSVLIFIAAPKWAHKTPLIYVLITGCIGSITVICCKVLGTAIVDFFGGTPVFQMPFFWGVLVLLVVFISIQLTFLNRALDIFNISIVTPILYVVFTSFVLIASTLVFSELSNQNLFNQIGLFSGLVTVIIGIFMITVLSNILLNVRFVDVIFSSNNLKLQGKIDNSCPLA